MGIPCTHHTSRPCGSEIDGREAVAHLGQGWVSSFGDQIALPELPVAVVPPALQRPIVEHLHNRRLITCTREGRIAGQGRLAGRGLTQK